MGIAFSVKGINSVLPYDSPSFASAEMLKDVKSKSNDNFLKKPSPKNHAGLQDDARSFRSKISAIRMLTRSEASCNSFLRYLQTIDLAEYLICYRDIEEIRALGDDQIISRTNALVWRYKTIYESYRVLGVRYNFAKIEGSSENNNNSPATDSSKHSSIKTRASFLFSTFKIHPFGNSGSNRQPDPANAGKNVNQTHHMEYLMWECLGKLRSIDIDRSSVATLLKHLVNVQNELLSRLIIPFEEYLISPEYKAWKEGQIEHEKAARNAHLIQINHRSSKKEVSDVNSAIAPLITSNMVKENYAQILPNILIVDDSMVTLKLTGKTLEKDGHHVDKAANGQIALELMKSHVYDVVLIDCNMPIMDGFEAVQLYREYEKEKLRQDRDETQSDVSSISDSEDEKYLLNKLTKVDEEQPVHQSEFNNYNLYRLSNFTKDSGPSKQILPNNNINNNSKSPFKNTLIPPVKLEVKVTLPLEDLSPIPSEPNSNRSPVKSNMISYGEQKQYDTPNKENSKSINLEDSINNPMYIPISTTTSVRTAPDANIIHLNDARKASGHHLLASNELKRAIEAENNRQLIVGMSSGLDHDIERRALESGMDYFMPKPFTLEKFIDVIKQSKTFSIRKSYHSAEDSIVARPRHNFYGSERVTEAISTVHSSHNLLAQ